MLKLQEKRDVMRDLERFPISAICGVGSEIIDIFTAHFEGSPSGQ